MNAIYFYFFFILIHPIISQWWKIFAKAERKSWEAFVPLYNYCVASKIGGQPFWYGSLMLFPGVHVVMYFVFNVALQRRFGLYGIKETALAIFLPWLQYAQIAANEKLHMLEATNWEDKQQVEQRTPGDHLALFLSLPLVGHVLAYTLGSVFKPAKGKTAIKDWGETILFALVAASIIRTYVFEPFKIPTGSMEKTLLIGDFLFVNKLAYGPKVPNTPLSFPLFHNNIPYLDVPSYSTLETVPYYRLPGWADVNRYDVVVFNYPSGDTAVYDPRMPMGLMGHDYHGIVLSEAKRLYFQSKNVKETEYLGDYFRRDYNKAISAQLDKKTIDSLAKIEGLSIENVFPIFEKSFYSEFLDNLEYWKNQARHEIAVNKRTYSRGEGMFIEHKGLIPRPVDKRENYIKRCVGVPGDTLQIIDAQLYVNGKKAPIFSGQNLGYIADGIPRISPDQMEERFGLVIGNDYGINALGQFVFFITKSEKDQLKKAFPEASFKLMAVGEMKTPLSEYEQRMDNLNYYPKSAYVQNNTENFQKFWVPKKGATIALTKENIIWYGRVITAYERHTLEEKNGKVFIDDKEANTYTFKMNYYWMMGDNRYNSADSRVWGFVPEDHIVGRAAIVWLSTDQRGSFPMNIRWKRVFTKIK
jgi:signal peptidase I